jgi:poly-gamma-glutamate synthesis protein (capsule biosynthesis protein)
MTHGSQITDAYDAETDSYDFTYCLENIAPLLQQADFTMGNLETTMGGGTPSGYPLFNSPDELAASLSTLGFDMVTTANNHCLDTTFDGLSRTLDVLDEAGIDHVGTYRTQEEYDENHGVLLEDINGISVAFVDYTYAVNGMPVYNPFSVNIFNSDYAGNQTTLDEDTLTEVLDYANSLNPDFIIACMHWGIEYQTVESDYQDEVADFLIAHGADAVLGGHPHVCQPMEYRTVTDDDGVEHTGFVCFSLGNFISGQTLEVCGPYTQDTAILNLTLTVDGASGEASISDISYIPLYFLNRGSSADPEYRMYNIQQAVADYEAGTPDEFVDETVYNTLVQAAEDLKTIFGERWTATDGSN